MWDELSYGTHKNIQELGGTYQTGVLHIPVYRGTGLGVDLVVVIGGCPNRLQFPLVYIRTRFGVGWVILPVGLLGTKLTRQLQSHCVSRLMWVTG